MYDVIAQHIFNNGKLQENIKVSMKEDKTMLKKKIKLDIYVKEKTGKEESTISVP
jgi:hypothetical protein